MVTLHNGKRGRLAKKIRKKIKNQKILTLSPTQKNPNPPPKKKNQAIRNQKLAPTSLSLSAVTTTPALAFPQL